MAGNKRIRDNAEFPTLRKEIGARIRDRREELHLTQKEVAQRIGVKRETITQWENGTRDIKTTDLVRLGIALSMSTDDILGSRLVQKNAPASFISCQLVMLIALHNTTKTALADYIGVSRQTVSQYCDGYTQPNAETIVRIADFFGVSCDYLLRGTIQTNMDVSKFQSLIQQMSKEKIEAAEKAIADLKSTVALLANVIVES